MRKQSLHLFLFLFALLASISSCSTSRKVSRKNADSLAVSIKTEKALVENKVTLLKKDKTITKEALSSLKDSYEILYTEQKQIIDDINSDSNIFKKKIPCVVESYKTTLLPYQNRLKGVALKSDAFVMSASKALNDHASIDIDIIGPIIMDAIKFLVDKKLEICKNELEKLYFKKWDEISDK